MVRFTLSVAKISSGETTTSLMSKELGIHYSTVRDWVKEYEQKRQLL